MPVDDEYDLFGAGAESSGAPVDGSDETFDWTPPEHVELMTPLDNTRAVLVTEDILTFARERLHFEVEASQIEFLQSEAKRGLVNCSRQWGKSTVMAIKVIYRALTRPGCLILIAGRAERQAKEFLSKLLELWKLGYPDVKLPPDRFHRPSVVFPNGSRVIGLPGLEKNTRCFSAVSLLVIDEAARAPDELYRALRPMLAVGNGDLWALSTPDGKRGFFYEEWEFGGDRWKRIRVPATECAPRISAEFLADEVAALGMARVREDYLCEFLDDNRRWFDRVLVEDAMTDEVPVFVVGGRRCFI